jgi:Zn-dependent protease
MQPNVKLGRIAGVEVGLNWSWLVIFGLIVWSLADGVFPAANPHLGSGTYVAMALAGALFFFASLLLHELGHATRARREGMEIGGITLWVFGGVARFKGMFPSAEAEFRIAIAGPLVSLAIGLVLVGAAKLIRLPPAVDGVCTWLGSINLLLLGFNLIPALPLDGGRMLRSTLWYFSGDFARATRTAAAVGRVLANVVIAGGVALTVLTGTLGGLWLVLIGAFIRTAVEAEARLVTIRESLAGMHVSDAMARDLVTIPADMTVHEFMHSPLAARRFSTYPVVAGGSIVGLLSLRRAATVPPSEWRSVKVADRMIGLDAAPIFDDGDDLGDAAAKLAQSTLGRALVMHGRTVVGLLSITDIGRMLDTRRARLAGP